MNTVIIIVEAYCETCSELWNRYNRHDPAHSGRIHAEQTGHRVRITKTIVEVCNQNGKKHDKQPN